jgi:hypothetical protein
MNWKCIRLELARTPDFPKGSASRAFLLRLPLGEDGSIDDIAFREEPRRATVRRYWPNEPDLSGHLIRRPTGWALSYRPGEDDESIFHLETPRLLPGEYITVTEPDGRRLPFRVAGVR